jgi:segregation and condensation protein A
LGSEYKVKLDSFAGPLDLLLYLVRKEEVDIYDIPISHVTKQYIQYIEMLKMLDIDLAGEFLVMAATLMEIKSVMLLPRPELDEQGEADLQDPRAELVRQLLEYKKFKDAANLLQGAAEERKLRFTRSDTILEKIKPTQEPELDLDQVSIWTLLEAFDSILQATGQYQSYDHITDDTPIDLYQIEMLHRLQTEGPMSLQKVFEGCDNRLMMIGLFLAMLELMRNHLVWVEQPDATGPIYLKSLTSEPAEEAVHNAIYANPEAMEQPAENEEPDSENLAEQVEVSQEQEIVEPQKDEDDEDELSKELAAIHVPSDEPKQPRKPRIPIMELPAEKKPKPSPKSVENIE